MKSKNLMYFILIMLGSMMLQDANAKLCSIWRDADGRWHSNCKLSDLIVQSNIAYQNRPPLLMLPNLKPKKVGYDVFPNTVDVKVKFENDGTRDVTQQFEIDVEVNVVDPANPNMPVSTNHYTLTSNGLLAGQDEELYVTSVSHTPPFHVYTRFILDPTSDERPGGQIWESNETDNMSALAICGYYPEGYFPTASEPEPCN